MSASQHRALEDEHTDSHISKDLQDPHEFAPAHHLDDRCVDKRTLRVPSRVFGPGVRDSQTVGTSGQHQMKFVGDGFRPKRSVSVIRPLREKRPISPEDLLQF